MKAYISPSINNGQTVTISKLVCSLAIAYTPDIRCMRILTICALHTCIMVVILTGYPIAGMVVADAVAHGGKDKDGCFKFSKRRTFGNNTNTNTFVIKVSQGYWHQIKSRSLVALQWQLAHFIPSVKTIQPRLTGLSLVWRSLQVARTVSCRLFRVTDQGTRSFMALPFTSTIKSCCSFFPPLNVLPATENLNSVINKKPQ